MRSWFLLNWAIFLVSYIIFTPGQPENKNLLNIENLKVINSKNANEIVLLEVLGRGRILDVTWSPDGKTIAAASETGVWLYDADDLNLPPYPLASQIGPTIEVKFVDNGSRLAAASQDGSVRIWDTTDLTSEPRTIDVNHGLHRAAFDLNGRFLAVVAPESAEIVLWNLQSGQEYGRLTGHRQPIQEIAFSIDGMLASASLDGTTRLWNAETLKLERTLQTHTSIDANRDSDVLGNLTYQLGSVDILA